MASPDATASAACCSDGDGARAAHVHGGREGEVVDAEVGREFLARRVAGRRHDAVDVGGGEPRVGDRGVGRLQHQLDGEERRPAYVVGFTDPDDGGFTREARHAGGTLLRG